MPYYSMCYAEDFSAYGHHWFEAENDAAAIEEAKRLFKAGEISVEVDYSADCPGSERILDVTRLTEEFGAAEKGEEIASDVYLHPEKPAPILGKMLAALKAIESQMTAALAGAGKLAGLQALIAEAEGQGVETTPQRPRRLAVALEGGLVSAVVSDDPSLCGLDVWIIDYDTEGADESEIVGVPQEGGEDGEAIVRCDVVSLATIDLDETERRVFAADEDRRATDDAILNHRGGLALPAGE